MKQDTLMMHLDGLARRDAQLAIFTARQLEQIRAVPYEKKYPELMGRTFVPVNNGINEGAASYTVNTIDEIGQADFVEDYGQDPTMADAKLIAIDNYKMRRIALAYGWSYDELLNAKFVGMDLSARKANNCRRGIERMIDKSLLLGFTARSMQGLFTLSGGQAPVVYTPSVTTWEDETPDAVAADIGGAVAKIITASNGVENPNRSAFAISTSQFLQQRRMGQGSNVSVWDYALGIQTKRRPDYAFMSSYYLEANAGHGGGAVKRSVTWEMNDDVLEGFVNEFTQLPPEFKSMRVITVCTARIGGVGVHRPGGLAYTDNV